MDTFNPKFGKEYYQQYYKKHKKEIFEKLGDSCVVCGSKSNLEIDHIDESNKSFGVLGNWSIKDKEILQIELEKCQLLCKACHKEKTRQYLSKIRQTDRTSKHGTISQYQRYKCRCDLCKEAQSKWHKEYRQRTGKN